MRVCVSEAFGAHSPRLHPSACSSCRNEGRMYASQPSCLPCDGGRVVKRFLGITVGKHYPERLHVHEQPPPDPPPRAYTQAPTYCTQYRAYIRACYTSNSSRVLEGASSHTRRASNERQSVITSLLLSVV